MKIIAIFLLVAIAFLSCKKNNSISTYDYTKARISYMKYVNQNIGSAYSTTYQYNDSGFNGMYYFLDPFTIEYKKMADGNYSNGTPKTMVQMNLDNQKRVVTMKTRGSSFPSDTYLNSLTYNTEGYISDVELKEARLDNNGYQVSNFVKVGERHLTWENGNLARVDAKRYQINYANNTSSLIWTFSIVFSNFAGNNSLSLANFGLDYFGKGGICDRLLDNSGARESLLLMEYLFAGKQLPAKVVSNYLYHTSNTTSTIVQEYEYTFDEKGRATEFIEKYNGESKIRYNIEYKQ